MSDALTACLNLQGPCVAVPPMLSAPKAKDRPVTHESRVMAAYPWFLLFAACPGGPDTPCNNRGVCLDRYWSTGECKCNTGFNGTACELCWPGRFGPDCQRMWHPPCPCLALALPLPCPCPALAPSPLCLWCITVLTQLFAP